jgi:PAS domain S-box-containing protein
VFQTILKGSLNQTGEWTYVRKGGGRFPVKLTLSSIKDQDGKLLGYIGLAIDITKEKQSISALRESEERFHNMFWDHSAVMILVDPGNGEIIEANKAAEQFYGIPFNNGPRLLISDLNTLSSDQVKEEMGKASLQKCNFFIFPHKLANGEIRTVEVHSSPIDVKGSKVLFSVIHDITERKVLEAALRMQSAAFESFAMTIIITDIQGRIQWVNPAFTQLTGYSVDEAIGKMPGELVKSGLQDKEFYKKFWDTLLNKEVWSGELINRRKDGSLYYEEETITPVLDTQGNISSFIAIKIDITERKKLYQELADEKRRLADIIKGTNVGTWEWNVQTGETRFNEQWANWIGYTLDEISPISIETWMRFAHPDDLKRSAELLEEHFKGELDYYSFESRMKHKNGNWIWVLDRGRVHDWDSEGKPFLMSGTHQDITERKKAEEKLQWNKSFLELMSNSSPLGFLVVDNRNDEILFFNHRFCQIWEIEQLKDQLTRGELKNNDIIPYCLAVLADIPAFAESCKPLQDEANRIVVEDEIAFTENRTVRRFTTQIRGGNDEYFGRFYIFEDITKRKRAESDLKKARNEAEKANHAKSEFLSRMSHELRTPMNSILGFAQLMDMGELNSKQKKGIKHIMNNGRHLLSLINDVLDISGIEAGRQILTPEPVQLAAIINEITDSIQIAANKRKVSIVLVDSPANSLFALADKLRLKQILINLLSNAIKYNNEGGSVTIKIAVQPTNESGRCPVKISICDTGNGIRPEDIGKLFQAFERIGADQTETEGTGLGLMVVKKLIEVMGGKVGVESVVGTGSTFWIELPISNNSKQDMSQTNGSPTPGLQETKHDTTILYIEDNPSNIELVEAIIEQHCPEIRLVTSIHGKQTLPLAKEYKPGLIMLDLNLPDMPGIDVLEQLLADDHTKAIPVIIISADAMPFQIEKLIKAGATDYLTKPLDIVQFLKTIEQHLNN